MDRSIIHGRWLLAIGMAIDVSASWASGLGSLETESDDDGYFILLRTRSLPPWFLKTISSRTSRCPGFGWMGRHPPPCSFPSLWICLNGISPSCRLFNFSLQSHKQNPFPAETDELARLPAFECWSYCSRLGTSVGVLLHQRQWCDETRGSTI